MQIVTKLVTLGRVQLRKGYYFRNILFNINSTNRKFSLKSSNNNQNEIDQILNKPFLLVPLHHLDEPDELNIEIKLNATQTCKPEKINNNTNKIINVITNIPTPTTLTNEINASDYFKNNNDAVTKQKPQSIQAFILKKFENTISDTKNIDLKDMASFAFNDDVRKKLEFLPITELNLKYAIEAVNFNEIIETYKNNLQADKTFKQLLPSIKFEAEIEGSIQLEGQKISDTLKEMDTNDFNALLSSLNGSICNNVLEEHIENLNRSESIKLNEPENYSENFTGHVKLKNIQPTDNGSKYLYYPNIKFAIDKLQNKSYTTESSEVHAQQHKTLNSSSSELNTPPVIKSGLQPVLKENLLKNKEFRRLKTTPTPYSRKIWNSKSNKIDKDQYGLPKLSSYSKNCQPSSKLSSIIKSDVRNQKNLNESNNNISSNSTKINGRENTNNFLISSSTKYQNTNQIVGSNSIDSISPLKNL